MSEDRGKQARRDLRDRLPLIERAAQTLHRSRHRDTDKAPAAEVRAPAGAVPPEAPAAKSAEAPAAEPAAVEPAEQATGGAARRSRVAQIDLSRLQAMGILTPSVTRSRTMEEFRIIKRPILHTAFSGNRRRSQADNLVMVTSTRPGEGKTFSAINLAISIASERDYTVLLVDADFTKPNVLRTLGLEAPRGLIDVLEDPKVDLADVLIRTNIDKLTVLPAGRPHHLSTELLASQRMADVVGEIARRYSDRLVIFDAPPVLSTSEPGALAMHVGQVVFVIEAEKTLTSAVKEALEVINVGPKIGVVLNRCRAQFGQAQFGSYYKR